jgi:hypothetical protein
MKKLGNNKKVCVVRPDFDMATKHSAFWMQQLLLPKLKELGYEYIDLYKDKANYDEFKKAMQQCVMLSGSGHGNEEVFTGQNKQVLLHVKSIESKQIMYGKFGSFLSCSFGNTAEEFAKAGMLGFFGYMRTYYFLVSFPDPRADDIVAQKFFKSHFTFDIAWLERKSTKDAFKLCIKAYNDEIVKTNDYTVARYLIWDRDSAVFAGDPNLNPFGTPEEELYKCPFCDYEDVKSKVQVHICQIHAKPCIKERCVLPLFLRKWIKCPLEVAS